MTREAMKHLSNDDLLAAVEDETSDVEHLEVCDACRARVEELRGMLSEARGVEMPEPSPLFWGHFSERVRVSIAEEPRTQPPLSRWGWAWPAGVLAALAVVIIAVAIARAPNGSAGPESATVGFRGAGAPGSFPGSFPRSLNDAPESELTSLASLTPPVDDPSWVFMTDLAGDLDWEDAGAAGLVARPGSAERALNNLSAAEREAVLDVLRQELRDRTTSSL